MFPVPLAIVIGWLAGVIVNTLSDDLPKRRRPQWPPRYPDGAPRPLIAWSGIAAFLAGKRASPGGARLSWRCVWAEVLTMLLMVLAVISAANDPRMTMLQLVFWLVYMAIFALITVIDIEHRLILFVVIIPSCIIAVIDALTTSYGATIGDALIGGAVGFGVFFVLYMGGFLFTYVLGKLRNQQIDEVAFGYGDVMLITLSGLILGWQALLFTMFITVVLGALGAILYLVVRGLTRRHYSLFTPLPYGPYIVAGTVLLLLYNQEVAVFFGAAPMP
jgi:leader peptidase (prepilin peptidase)/N-methyltransferase